MDVDPGRMLWPEEMAWQGVMRELATTEEVEDLRMLVSQLWDITQDLRREVEALKEGSHGHE